MGKLPQPAAANGGMLNGTGSAHANDRGGNGCNGIRGYTTALPFEPLVYTFKDISYSVPLAVSGLGYVSNVLCCCGEYIWGKPHPTHIHPH